MTKERLEAFTDGVIAILITIMVLELKAPDGTTLAALRPLLPLFLTYLLSFAFLGIYWTNHHHMLRVVTRVNGKVLWANLHLLFWLSLIPFVTWWMGGHHVASVPTALYGTVLLLCAVAYRVLQNALVGVPGQDPLLARAMGRNFKGLASEFCYVAAIPLAFVNPWISDALFVIVALIWIVPDQRIESRLPADG
ncbi:MAG: TMEM175 family protein [Gemmatimonadaceae bacterium]